MKNVLLIETENGIVVNVANYGNNKKGAIEALKEVARDNLEDEWVQEYIIGIEEEGELYVDWFDEYGAQRAVTFVEVECIGGENVSA